MSAEYSFNPYGEKFRLPGPDDYAKEFERLKEIVPGQRALGREIVVVMGLGFVGAVMAAVIADTEDKKGNSTKFVVCMQRPSTRSYWKIPLLNRGIAPMKAEDPEIAPMIHRCVNEKKTLTSEKRGQPKTPIYCDLFFLTHNPIAPILPLSKSEFLSLLSLQQDK